MAAMAGTKVGSGYVEVVPDFSRFQERVGRQLAGALTPKLREAGGRAGREFAKGFDRGGIGRSLSSVLKKQFEKVGDDAGKAIADRIGKKARPAANDMFGLADAIGEVERRSKGASSASKSLETDMFGVGRAAKTSGKQIVSARAGLRDWHREARAGSDAASRFRDRLRGLTSDLRKSGREARAAGGGFGGINGGMARVNRGFSFFRNLIRTLKWPILIAGLGLTAQGLSALAAGAVAATSALGPLAGSLIVLPAAAVAAAQAFGVLKLATAGVGDAIKAALDAEVQGGAQAVDTMRQQEDAAERVADAKRNLASTEDQATFAAEDFRRAHEEARRELENLRFAADEADESIESAAIGLRRAKQELNRTLSDPQASALDVREAELSVEQAENDLRRIRVEAQRTREDYRKARKAGVSGMPEVVAAKRAEVDADRAVVDAERDLRRAVVDGKAAMEEQGAAASALQEKMSQLPVAGQKFVRFLVSLKPRLDALRATAAGGFFPGAEEGLRGLLGNFSEVRTVVGETSNVFGRLASRAGKKLGSAVWGKDLLRIGRLNTKVLDRMGDVTFNLADAFRHILISARPFLNWLSKGTVKLSEWIKGEAQAGRETGRLGDFFDRTRKTMELLGPILKGVGGALLNIGEAARPLGNEILKALGGSAEGWSKWTDSVAGKNDLKQYFAEAKPAIFEMGKLIGAAGKAFFQLGKQRGVAHLLQLVRTELIPALTEVTGAVTGWAGDFLKQFGQLRQEGVPTFEAFIRVLVNHAGQAGWAIAKALGSAFLHAGIWGKLAISTFLISKLGGFRALSEWGFEAGGRLGKRFFEAAGTWIAGTEAGGSLLGWFQGVFGKNGRFGKAAKAAGTRMGMILGRGMAVGAIAGLVLFAPTIRDAIDKYIKDPLNEALGGVFGDKFKGVLSKAQELIDPANLGPVPTALGLDVKGFVKGKVVDLSEMFTGTAKAEDRLRKFSHSVGREGDRARKNFRRPIDDLPGIAERSMRGVNRQSIPRLGELADQGGRKSDAFARRVAASFAGLSGLVKNAIGNIGSNVREALGKLGGGKGPVFNLKEMATGAIKSIGSALGFQQGGFIVPGSGSGDKFKTVLPAGSFVLNREATAAFGFQKGGLTPVALEAEERVFPPHEVKAMGGPRVLEGMNRAVRRQKGGPIGKAPMLAGPAGALRDTGRAAIDKVHGAARGFVASKMPRLGSGLLTGNGNVEKIFAKVAKRLSKSKIASLALGMAGFAESRMRDLGYGDSTSQGALQLLASTAASTGIDPHDEGAIASAFLTTGYTGKGGANKLAAQGLPAHLVAQGVQGSAFSDGSNYLAQEGPAKAWMKRFGLKLGGMVGEDRDGQPFDPRVMRGGPSSVPREFFAATGFMPKTLGRIKAKAQQIASAFTGYVWGGGHGEGTNVTANGLDCSGAIAKLVQHSGWGDFAVGHSSEYASRFMPGAGDLFTLWSNNDHTFADIAGQQWGTNTSNGLGFHSHPTSGFTPRHPKLAPEGGAGATAGSAGVPKEKILPVYRGAKTGDLNFGPMPKKLEAVNREIAKWQKAIPTYRTAKGHAERNGKPGYAQAIGSNLASIEQRLKGLHALRTRLRLEKVRKGLKRGTGKAFGKFAGYEQLIEGSQRTYERAAQDAEQIVALEPQSSELPATATDAQRAAAEKSDVARFADYVNSKERPGFGRVLDTVADWRNNILRAETFGFGQKRPSVRAYQAEWETVVRQARSKIDSINTFTKAVAERVATFRRENPKEQLPKWLRKQIDERNEMRQDLPFLQLRDQRLTGAVAKAREMFFPGGENRIKPPPIPLAGSGSLEEALKGVQGIHWPDGHELLPASELAPPRVAGRFGGVIWDVQTSIEELGLKISQAANSSGGGGASSGEGDSERASLLEQLLRETNQRTAISDAQGFALKGWDKLRQGIKGNFGFQVGGLVDLPKFHGGGRVEAIRPGPGEVPLMAKVGESVLDEDDTRRVEQMAAMGGAAEFNFTVNGNIVQEPGDTRPAIEIRDSKGNLVKEVQSAPGTGRRHPSAFRTRP